MKWLLGTYTQRWNRRWQRWGHLFGGRYKAQPIDERSPSYLRAACDYVHLNPARARLLTPQERLEGYAWSSYPAYLRPRIRPAWLRTDRLLGEHRKRDRRADLDCFARGMEAMRGGPNPAAALASPLRGWHLGAEDFAARLSEKLGRRGASGEQPGARRETDEQLAERLIQEGLQAAGWTSAELGRTAKAHPVKVELARRLRQQTPMTRAWIAARLEMGSASYVSALLSVDSKL
jgi:hypothetical protein